MPQREDPAVSRGALIQRQSYVYASIRHAMASRAYIRTITLAHKWHQVYRRGSTMPVPRTLGEHDPLMVSFARPWSDGRPNVLAYSRGDGVCNQRGQHVIPRPADIRPGSPISNITYFAAN